MDNCSAAGLEYLRAAHAGAVQLAHVVALVESLRYSKVPLMADLCQNVVEALRCGELELATSRGLRVAMGAVQLGALLTAKTSSGS